MNPKCFYVFYKPTGIQNLLGLSKRPFLLTASGPVTKFEYHTELSLGDPLVGLGVEFPPVTRRGRPLGILPRPRECQF